MNPTRSAVIVIRRHTNFWMGGLRDIVIRIDGRRVGKVKRGEAAEFVVDPGECLVTVSMDWVRSRPVRVAVEPGERAELLVESRPGGVLKMLVPLVCIVLLAQVIVSTLAGSVVATGHRLLLFFGAYSALFGGYVLATAWFAADYWALFSLEPVKTNARRATLDANRQRTSDAGRS